jgi:polyhydroxyalkanoate synthesis regulator phasin
MEPKTDSERGNTKGAKGDRVDDSLMREMHDANEHFHTSKQALEKTMSDTDYGHQERVDRAIEQVREAERQVEEISGKIHDALNPPAAS